MTCSIKKTETDPIQWKTGCAIATATVAAVTLVVCSLLAILVSQNVINLQISIANLLIIGASGAVFFGLISLALRYCSKKNQKNTDTNPLKKDALKDTNQMENEALKKENTNNQNIQNTNIGGHSYLNPDATGSVGALGDSKQKTNLIITTGKRKDFFGKYFKKV